MSRRDWRRGVPARRAHALGVIAAVLAGPMAAATAGDLGRSEPSFFQKLGAPRDGNFGRPGPSVFDGLLPNQLTLGPVTRVPGDPLTDAEEELRNRAYDLIRLPQRREEWKLILASARVAKLLPPSLLAFDRAAYGNMLVGLPFRSETGRYSRLLEDVIGDSMLIGPFMAVACLVFDMDAKRERSLPYVAGLTEGERADAEARVIENRLVVTWVERSLEQRAWSYRYAAERLVIASPSPMAIEAERAIDRLRAQIAGVEAYLTPCGGGTAVVLQASPPRRLITK
jgi:hypothetical protein